MNILVVDDELKGRLFMQTLLNRFFAEKVTKVGMASSVDEAADYIHADKPDLVFLDIEMPGKNGFELLRMFPDAAFEVIFITAHDNYAVRAFQFSALDYLLKPVNTESLSRALDKAEAKIKANQTSGSHYKVLLENLKNTVNPFHKISIPTIHGFEFISIPDIIRLEADGNYSVIHLTEKKQIVSSRTLKEFDHLLTDLNFFRVHKSHLVNLAFVKAYQRGEGGTLLMSDGINIDVSRRNKQALLERLTGL